MKENTTVLKIVNELHEAQGKVINYMNQLEFMNVMVSKMAEELSKIDGVDPKTIIEEYTYKAYEQLNLKDK